MNTEPDSRCPSIDIEIDDDRWIVHFPELEEDVTQAFKKVVQKISPHLQTYQVCLVFSHNQAVQELNKTYRHKNKPTNVLSFPADTLGVPLPVKLLGDIIMAFETVKQEALEQNKTFRDHTLHLTVHGALHLFGYDHVIPEAAEQMESLEIEILSELGIANPYEVSHA